MLANALHESESLAAGLDRMGFVQADPIRAPARAQDLILRHRLAGYRAGELEARYPALDVEEDFLYAYGFAARPTHHLLHPRGGRAPSGLAAEVLAFVRAREATHPRDLVAAFGERRQVNAWGGMSRATTKALELLHYRGYLRVARRERGVRLYAAARDRGEPLAPAERLRKLVLLLARTFAPLPEVSLRSTIGYLRWGAPSLRGRESVLASLLKKGALEAGVVEGVRYLWPTGSHGVGTPVPPTDGATVRLLAPFDPIVWDRRRLEHLWQWDYRFEAYTPLPRRRFGYYALPVLWDDRFVGWANVSWQDGALDVGVGYRDGRPRGRDFARAFEDEVERLRAFLAGPA